MRDAMRQLGAWAVLAAGLSFGALRASAVVVGDGVDGLVLKPYGGGGDLSPGAAQGKVTLINFWATWCAACKVELTEMEGLLKPEMEDKDFQVAFVALDKDPAKAADWFQHNLKDPDRLLKNLYVDAAFEIADKLGVDSFPMTIIIGRDGKVAHVQKGFKEGQGSTASLVKIVSDLLRPAH